MTRTMATATVHLVGPGKVKIHQGRLAFSTGDGSPAQFDVASLRHVICYGEVGLSDEAIRALFEAQVQVSWLSPRGNRIRGRMQPVGDSTVQLRMQQYARSSSADGGLELARWIVQQKMESQMAGARHFQRHGNPEAGVVLERLGERMAQAGRCGSAESLRGLEGSASTTWFQFLGTMTPAAWEFRGRNRRPPRDPFNALLSLGYACVMNRVSARLQAEGFELQIGFLHEYRAGRPSLACDVIEPLRVPSVDRWALRLSGLEQLTVDDFESSPEDGMRLTKGKFSVVLQSFEEHWLRIQAAKRLEQLVANLRQRITQP
ncbi:MAG: CRISPR-associated endonuclease Cas1 [Pirellulales bacterium]